MSLGRTGWYGTPSPAEVWEAVDAARALRPRPAHPAAVALLVSHAHHLAHFGGCAGLLDACDAAASLTWALKAFAALMLIARAGRPAAREHVCGDPRCGS